MAERLTSVPDFYGGLLRARDWASTKDVSPSVAYRATLRVAYHVDFGVIALFFQEGVGGLEAQDRSKPGLDLFIPIPPTDDTEIVITLGATMQRDIIVLGSMSIASLFKANKGVSVGPTAAFVDENSSAKYSKMMGLEYHQWRNSQFYQMEPSVAVSAAARYMSISWSLGRRKDLLSQI
ncbi:MAG: hypothetical protein HETSPECPRED_003046 [Heterodermia speciosa]|uniref:Uncharacterized protein n=1 Tax=Heterodermia speciosa TaxID=116794 RepID=A0A8H3J5W3_9LECA|nr:MAG: hypothetical protein HETSPECPRED_003046 [Heterodermia speciosa]